MTSISKKQLIYLIGIGAFVFITITSISHLSKNVLKDIQIWLGQDPLVNFWISAILSIIVFNTLGFGLLYAFIKKNDFSLRKLRKIFLILIVLYLVSLLLHFLHSFYYYGFVVGERINEFENYNKLVNDDNSFGIWQMIFGMFEYFNFILLIFIGQKIAPKTIINNV